MLSKKNSERSHIKLWSRPHFPVKAAFDGEQSGATSFLQKQKVSEV